MENFYDENIETGIFYDMPFSDYLSLKAVSRSDCKIVLEKSLYHLQQQKIGNSDYKTTDAMRIGRAVHSLFLEGEQGFNRDVVISPYEEYKTKVARDWKKETEDSGLVPIKKDMFDSFLSMKEALASHPLGKFALKDGKPEVTIVAKEPITGLPIKVRADWLNVNLSYIFDYKTCEDASTDKFFKDVKSYAYDIQTALYSDALSLVTGKTTKFIFLSQEKSKPYAINLVTLPQAMHEIGQIKYMNALIKIRQAMETGIWSGYADEKINEVHPSQFDMSMAEALRCETQDIMERLENGQ